MKNLQRILVSIDSAEHARFLVEKALRLRDYATAELVFIQPIYDELAEDAHMHFTIEEHDRIIQLLLEVEELKFDHFISSVAFDNNWRSTVKWCKRPWQGILETASRYECDLIIKDAFIETRLNKIIHTPHDWNLLRSSDRPVMMIKPKPWVDNSNVVAAIDVFDSRKHELNVKVLQYAASITELLRGKLHVANALPSLRSTVLERSSLDTYKKLTLEVEACRYAYMQQLVDESGTDCEEIHVVIGVPYQAISDLVDRLEAEFIVIGKVRPAVADFMGTTAELLLHSVNSDMISISSRPSKLPDDRTSNPDSAGVITN
jgi:universal stress protein E